MKTLKYLIGVWFLLIWVIASFDWFPRWISNQINNELVQIVLSIGFSITLLAAIIVIVVNPRHEGR